MLWLVNNTFLMVFIVKFDTVLDRDRYKILVKIVMIG